MPAPTAEPTPEPTVPAPTAEPTPTPEPTAESTPPADVRAVRSETGVMLTVRSEGPPWDVVTPCYNIATISEGLALTGPVDVLIDPGHGGEETGAVGPNGLREADVNLLVAEALRLRLLDAGYSVLLTRYSDHRMAIQARTDLAKALEPRVFISIHHNGGFPDPVDQPGTEVFVQYGDDESRRLGGLLWEEMQAEFDDLDIPWVGTDALGVSWRQNESGTDLYGILRRTPDLVTVLTEAMYMTTAAEAEFLATEQGVEREADALFRGLVRWFDTASDGSGHIDGLVFRGDLGTGGGTEGCVDPPGSGS